jgi:hypothetical protein
MVYEEFCKVNIIVQDTCKRKHITLLLFRFHIETIIDRIHFYFIIYNNFVYEKRINKLFINYYEKRFKLYICWIIKNTNFCVVLSF